MPAQISSAQLATAAVCRGIVDTVNAEMCVVIASQLVSARHRVHATDDVAGWLDERQYVLGQGPTVEALTTRAPVLVADTDAVQVETRWPGFAQEIAGHPVRAVFAFPLLVGDAVLGTAQLHRAQPQDLTPSQVAALPGMLTELVAAVLDDYAEDADAVLTGVAVDDGSARVAMAVGMVAVQLGTTLPTRWPGSAAPPTPPTARSKKLPPTSSTAACTTDPPDRQQLPAGGSLS